MYLIDTNVTSEQGKRHLAVIDKQIAATALVYDLTVVTRNTRDFAGTGARLLNPFS